MVKNFDRSLLESSQGWHCASSACIWERKANLEVFAEELKIFMHTHMLSAGPCTQANRMSLASANFILKESVVALTGCWYNVW